MTVPKNPGMFRVHRSVQYRNVLGIFTGGDVVHPGWFAKTVLADGTVLMAWKKLYARKDVVEVWATRRPSERVISGFLRVNLMR